MSLKVEKYNCKIKNENEYMYDYIKKNKTISKIEVIKYYKNLALKRTYFQVLWIVMKKL